MPLKKLYSKLTADPTKFTMPEGTNLGPTDISLTGDRMIEVSLCLGICLYSDEKIVLRIREGRLIVCGSSLRLRTYRCRRIAVVGRIRALSFEKS